MSFQPPEKPKGPGCVPPSNLPRTQRGHCLDAIMTTVVYAAREGLKLDMVHIPYTDWVALKAELGSKLNAPGTDVIKVMGPLGPVLVSYFHGES